MKLIKQNLITRDFSHFFVFFSKINHFVYYKRQLVCMSSVVDLRALYH